MAPADSLAPAKTPRTCPGDSRILSAGKVHHVRHPVALMDAPHAGPLGIRTYTHTGEATADVQTPSHDWASEAMISDNAGVTSRGTDCQPSGSRCRRCALPSRAYRSRS